MVSTSDLIDEQQEDSAKSWLPSIFQRRKRDSKLSDSTEADERTILLPKPTDTPNSGETGETYIFEDRGASRTKLWINEFIILLKGSLPVIVAYTLQNSLQTISVIIVGRLSPEALATAAFSYMFAMSTAWLIALGGTTALDTLASSSYTGSKNPHDLGILLQRGFVVLTAFYIPVAILWYCSAPVFRLLGQEEYICVQSAQFLTALIPGGLGYIYFEATKKFLQAQGMHILSHQSSPRS
jgi:MATE family multidrug resistance protein